MTVRARHRLSAVVPRAVVALAVAAAALPALAQFKVIGADGKVTYTDREPSAAEGRVVPIGSRAVSQAPAEPELPFELRQTAGRYPVTLYVTTTACVPCNTGREMLKQRGVPFAERLVVSAEDSEALERLSGGREAPTLAIGAQILRGYAAEVWTSYLDAAGYPKESQLPSNYQYRPPTPVVDRRESTPARPEARAEARTAPAPATAPVAPGGFRF